MKDYYKAVSKKINETKTWGEKKINETEDGSLKDQGYW